MASKLTFAHEENEKIVKQVIGMTTLDTNIPVKVLSNESQKEVILAKLTTVKEKLLSQGILLTITINEEIFDRLVEEFQEMVILEALHPIHLNNNGDYTMDKADVVTHSGYLEKIEIEKYLSLIESVKSIKDTIENGAKTVEKDLSQQAIKFTEN